MIDLGHRNIAQIRDPLNNYGAHNRYLGWLSTMHDNGLIAQRSVEGDFTIASGHPQVRGN